MKLLIWIMSRFSVSPELIGDITEEAPGRSHVWVLRQSVLAILSTVGSDLWRQKLRTLVSTAVAWFLWVSFNFAMSVFYNTQLHPTTLALALASWWAFVVGLAISQIHRSQPLGASMLFVVTAYVLIAPVMAATMETMYVNYPVSRIYLLEVLADMVAQNASFVLFTFLGATVVRRAPTATPTPD